jgi:hypothetical protein
VAIPKKGSRKIHVSGTDYRWAVRKKPTYSEGAYASNMTAAVELYTSPVSTLLIEFTLPRPDNWLGQEGMVVTPLIVQKQIARALQDGWDPLAGNVYELRQKADS